MYKALIPVSGGKDSQACLQLALQRFEKHEILGLFCDTQFEHPKTYKHIDFIRQFYGVEIDRVCVGDVLRESEKWGRFPGGGSRHCTDYLKIRPTKQYIKSLAEKQGKGFEVWYGMRSDESAERKARYEFKIEDELYFPHEVMPSKYPKYLAKMGIQFRLPVLSWTTAEVLIFESIRARDSSSFGRLGDTITIEKSFNTGNTTTSLAQELAIEGIQYSPTGVGQTDVLAANQMSQNQLNQNYQARVGQQNALMSGLFSLGSAGIGASDRRLKRDIKRVGTMANGLPVYEYRYVWGRKRHIGVMAQDVLKAGIDAVVRHWTGFLMVDYGKL